MEVSAYFFTIKSNIVTAYELIILQIADIYISISMGKRIQANHVVIHRKYKSRGEDGNK